MEDLPSRCRSCGPSLERESIEGFETDPLGLWSAVSRVWVLASAEWAASSCGLDADFVYFPSPQHRQPWHMAAMTVTKQTELPRENCNTL